MTGLWAVLITTFLASAVEAIEMVTIVVGVGATRGWRSTIIGAASGFGVLAVIVLILGAALSVVPIGPLRLVIGALLLVFGLQWFRKGIMRVALRGLAGIGGSDPHGDAELWRRPGMDWTAWFLAFKGVVLEGLEVAIIVVSFGAGANQLGGAVVGGGGAIVVVGPAGLAVANPVRRVSGRFLELVGGIFLTTFAKVSSLRGLRGRG